MHKKPNDPEVLRRRCMRSLFAARYAGKSPNGNDVLVFCRWLEGHNRKLLPPVTPGDDPYQQLKIELDGFYRD
jgi:hypothetical protein